LFFYICSFDNSFFFIGGGGDLGGDGSVCLSFNELIDLNGLINFNEFTFFYSLLNTNFFTV